MLAKQVLSQNNTFDDLPDIYDINGVLFDAGGFTQLPETFKPEEPLSNECPSLVNSTFASTGEERHIKVALGYASPEAKDKFWSNMAFHLASGYSSERIGNANIDDKMKGSDSIEFAVNPKNTALVISTLVTWVLLA